MSDDSRIHITSAAAVAVPATDLAISLDAIAGKPGGTITIRPGITTLVGPNGSGKARHSRLASSMIDRMRNLRPSCVRPSTKSYDQTWPGYSVTGPHRVVRVIC